MKVEIISFLYREFIFHLGSESFACKWVHKERKTSDLLLWLFSKFNFVSFSLRSFLWRRDPFDDVASDLAEKWKVRDNGDTNAIYKINPNAYAIMFVKFLENFEWNDQRHEIHFIDQHRKLNINRIHLP